MKKTNAGRPRLGRPPATDSADTRRLILDTARRAFARYGFDTATNRNLGTEMGLTAGAIYHYFGSKLDLYLAVQDDVHEQVFGRWTKASEPHTTFRGKFDAILEEAHEMNKEDRSFAQFLGAVRVDMHRNADVRAKALQKAAESDQFFLRIVDLGVKTGEIDRRAREQVSALLATMLIGLTDAMSGSVTRHRIAIDAIKAALDGQLIGPPKADGVKAKPRAKTASAR